VNERAAGSAATRMMSRYARKMVIPEMYASLELTA